VPELIVVVATEDDAVRSVPVADGDSTGPGAP
jgi:hypothetical protein